MVVGAQLEDARHLAQRYEKMRQEAETQTIEVSKCQIKLREAPGYVDNSLKLEAAETKLQELKSNMTVLGKEAIAAMAAVEAQQQRLTLQRLIAMVHLWQLDCRMVSKRQGFEASPSSVLDEPVPPPQSCEEADGVYPSHTFDGLTDFYLHLQVSKNGWAEGECKGKAGWFPFGYVERRDRVLASKIAEIF
ncbi:hypothetical protein B296_00020062 [Ensete ventricosum]|uniref:SH3 domain-containing protein n=1 Tax=Ensete ventricosum TaxID=4639 RepID=A0A426YG56_ENSVE|nr:hypothetical protein B296_00020062 [Ensete ventricosum]